MGRLTFFLSILFSTLSLSATEWKVKGMVTDTKGEALPGTSVYIQDSFDGASTDIEGRFQFSTTATFPCTLIVEFIGYESISQELNSADDLNSLRFQLKETFSKLKAVTITAGAFEASDTKKAATLKPLDIVTTAGALGDVAGALQTLPGATPVGEDGRLFVRGGSANETQTYIDGMLVHVPYTNSAPNTAVRGRFNPFLFSGTTFNTGGYSAEYGQALSSVLLLETKGAGIEDEVNLGLMTVGADAAATKTWDGGSATGSISYIDLEPYTALIPQNLTYNRAPRIFTGEGSTRQEFGKGGTLKNYAQFARTHFDVNQTDPGHEGLQRVQGNEDFTYTNSSWRQIIGDKWILDAGNAYTHHRMSTGLDDFSYEQELEGNHSKLKARYLADEQWKLSFGADYFYKSYTERYGEGNFKTFDVQDSKLGLFTEADVFLSNDFALRGGLRLEHTPSRGQVRESWTLAPRLMAAYSTGDNSQVSFAYGRFYQDAHQRTLLYSGGVDQEQSEHFILNYQYTLKDRIFRVELYQKDYSDLVVFDRTGEAITDYRNEGQGYARGFDLWFRDNQSIKNGDYWISYSYLDTERQVNDMPYAAAPTFAAAHSFSLVYKHWIQDWRSQVGMSWTVTSPRLYTDPNLDGIQNREMQADMPLALNWAYLFREHVIFYASVTNVLGQDRQFGHRFAEQADIEGFYASEAIVPAAERFVFLGCFITFSKNAKNQLDQLQ